MPGIVQSIELQAVGGADAASQIGMANNALKQTEATSDALQEKFQHKFQHLGLQLFAQDALRMIGLGSEAREVMGIMNMGISALGASFGAAAGPIGLGVTALFAAVGAYQKIADKQKDAVEAAAKLVEVTDKERKSTQDSLGVLTEYQNTVGKIPPTLRALLEAKRQLVEFQEQQERKALQEQVVALEKSVVAQEADIQSMMAAQEAARTLTAQKFLLIAVAKGGMEAVQLAALSFQNFQKNIDTAKESLLKNNVALAEARDRLRQLAEGGIKGYDELGKAAKKEADDAKKAIDDEAEAETRRYQSWAAIHAKQIEDRRKEVEEESKQETERYQNLAKLHYEHLTTKKQLDDKYAEEYKSITNGAIHDVSQNFADSFVQMAFHGKNFMESMVQGFQQMTEKIIADIIRMEIEYAILNSIAPGAGAGAGFFKMAEGGSVMVDKPTWFLAGEAGQPEMATFTPLSKMGSGGSSQMPSAGGNGTMVIQKVETNIHGVQNPEAIADNVGRAIINRIRGMGELNFLRAG